MVTRQLFVVRINQDYDTKLLDELVLEAIKPFGGMLEYVGVKESIEELQFDPSVESNGVPLWVLLHKVVPYLQYQHGQGDMLAIMPHPLGGAGPTSFTNGFGPEGITFLSTYAEYVNPSDPNNFVKYGAKIAAHELGHSAFGLEHHEQETFNDDGFCLMYLKDWDGKQSMDKQSMKFCEKCYSNIIQSNTS